MEFQIEDATAADLPKMIQLDQRFLDGTMIMLRGRCSYNTPEDWTCEVHCHIDLGPLCPLVNNRAQDRSMG
jgi:hypothetical protein